MDTKLSRARRAGNRWVRTTLAQTLTRLASVESERRRRRFWRRGRWRLLLIVVLAFALPSIAGHSGQAHAPSAQASAQPTTQQAAATVGASATPAGVSTEVSLGAGGGPQAVTVPADSCGITDIQQCLSDFINTFLQQIAQWWQTQVNNVTALGFMFYTPDSVSYNAPIVQQIQTYSLTVVAAFLALVILVAGYNHMTGRTVSWTETLPQIVLCGMMAWGIQAILIFAIDLSNAFIQGLYGVNLNTIISGNSDTSTMGVIAFIFELILDLGLALESLARLALLDLLLAIAPIGVFCFALPQTRTWGRLWAEGFVATLLIQPVQAVVVVIGSWFMSNLTELFGPNFPPIVQLLLGIACAFLAIRVPAILGRFTHYGTDLRGQVSRLAMQLASAAT